MEVGCLQARLEVGWLQAHLDGGILAHLDGGIVHAYGAVWMEACYMPTVLA